jgi:hypothetical protein
MVVKRMFFGPPTPATQCVGGQTVSAAQRLEVTHNCKTQFKGKQKFQNWLTSKKHVCEKGAFGATYICNTMCVSNQVGKLITESLH